MVLQDRPRDQGYRPRSSKGEGDCHCNDSGQHVCLEIPSSTWTEKCRIRPVPCTAMAMEDDRV